MLKPWLTSAAVMLFATAARAQTTLRYDLVNGDHLVYRESVDRSAQGKSAFATHAEFSNHLLVTSDPKHPELLIVGAQRNRTKGELLRSLANGKDTVKSDRKEFEVRLAAEGTVFAEANRYDRTALPAEPVTARREWTSQVLFDVRELMPLPVEAVRVGSQWRGTSLLGVGTHYAGNETVHGRDCVRMEGEDRGKKVEVRTWFCAATGLVEKVEFNAKLGEDSDEEKISFEFVGRTRGESPGNWMGNPETREAWLQMTMLEPSIPVDAASLLPLLNDGDAHLQRRTLALWYRRKMAEPDAEVVARLKASMDTKVRGLVAMIAPAAAPKNAKYVDGILRVSGIPANCASKNKPKFELAPGDYWMTLEGGPIPGWPYILHVPEEYRADTNAPAILYLNGGAGQAIGAMNNARLTEAGTGYMMIYPQARKIWWEPESIEMVRELLHEVKERYAIDANRFYVTGMSNGGTGTFLYATLWPDQFAAAGSLMGAGFQSPGRDKPLGENTSALPMLFAHGDQDKVIPMQASVDAVDQLKRMDRSAPVELKVMQGVEHELVLDDNGGNVPKFFEDRVRNAYPKKVHVRMRTVEDPRQYWVEVLEKGDGLAEVDADVVANVVTVRSKNVRKIRLRLRPEVVSGDDVRVMWNGKVAWQGSVGADCSVLTNGPDGDVALGYSREVVLEGGSK